MTKDYRNIRGIKMGLKSRPEIIPPLKWNGPSEQDLNLSDLGIPNCVYCGNKMEPYQDYGNTLFWRCHGWDHVKNQPCVNNPDGDLRDMLTSNYIQNAGNKLALFQDWMPPRLI